MTPDLAGAFAYSDSSVRELAGYGAGALAQIGRQLGADPTGVDVSFSIGAPPHEAVLVRGGSTDPEAFEAKLTELGAEAGDVAGEDGLVWGEEGENHLEAGSEFAPIGATGEFNRTILGDGEIATGRFAAEVAALAGEGDGDTLADDDVFSAYAECLGDVVAAVGSDTGDGYHAAAGVRRPGAKPATEVICAVGGDQAALEARLREFEDPDAELPSTRQPVSDLFSEVTVDTGEGFVRMTVTDAADRAPGIALEALLRRDLL